jgi:hypothetical protein
MTQKEVFLFGAIGAILPLIVSALAIDLGSMIDHGQLTVGNYIGYGFRVVVFIIAGGIVALVNTEVKTRGALIQLGITAPAVLTAYINGVNPAPKAPDKHSAFAIVSVANAAEVSPQNRVQVADSLLKDIGAGFTTRLDAVSRANQANQRLGTFCVTSQGKSPLPGAAQPIGGECSNGGQKGLVTN